MPARRSHRQQQTVGALNPQQFCSSVERLAYNVAAKADTVRICLSYSQPDVFWSQRKKCSTIGQLDCPCKRVASDYSRANVATKKISVSDKLRGISGCWTAINFAW